MTPLAQSSINQLTTQVAIAAGVPVVTEAVGKAWRLRGGLATGWPVLAWVAKFKPDPLRRLHLDRLGVGRRRRLIPRGSGVRRCRRLPVSRRHGWTPRCELSPIRRLRASLVAGPTRSGARLAQRRMRCPTASTVPSRPPILILLSTGGGGS